VNVLNGITAAAFGLYAVGLGTTGVLSGQSWLQIFSFMAIGASTLLWMFGDQLWAYPFAAAVTLIVLVVPGQLLVRRQHARAAQQHA
jgi:hypothetical protein